ncbi:hypothetical protein PPEP_a1027 [Pseudoalteromonas peptidolytica F12-50-A1]|uniref:Uncharacterized protein n=1 Tax=Pseudoalteromonas peptidolytica F12-50-A1 TaxID=1315280 RepID=A0A8I0T3J3_9GAMM|nr:hypothetical protein [Pseudoalteromonas peptidolytica F12-50-A1]
MDEVKRQIFIAGENANPIIKLPAMTKVSAIKGYIVKGVQ